MVFSVAFSKAFSCFCLLKGNAFISQVRTLFIYSIYMSMGQPLWQAAWPACAIKCWSKLPFAWGKQAYVIMQSRLSPHSEFVESIKTTVVDEVRWSRWYFSWVFLLYSLVCTMSALRLPCVENVCCKISCNVSGNKSNWMCERKTPLLSLWGLDEKLSPPSCIWVETM